MPRDVHVWLYLLVYLLEVLANSLIQLLCAGTNHNRWVTTIGHHTDWHRLATVAVITLQTAHRSHPVAFMAMHGWRCVHTAA